MSRQESAERYLRSLRLTEDAIAHKTELDKILAGFYPLIDNSQKIEAYERGDFVHGSFDVRGSCASKVILSALNKAIADHLAISDHGSEHQVYEEVVRRVLADIQEGKGSWRRNSRRVKIYDKGEGNCQEHVIERLVIEGVSYWREIKRPLPHDQAIEMKVRVKERKLDEKGVRRSLAALGKEYGPAFLLLTCIFLGKNEEQILEIFDSLRGDLRGIFGKKIILPGPFKLNGRINIPEMAKIGKLIDVIVHYGEFVFDKMEYFPSLPKTYDRALALMQETYRWTDEMLGEGVRTYVSKPNLTTPLVVFKSMTEMAYRSAPVGLTEPERSVYIREEYDPFSTTEVLTAYLRIDPYLRQVKPKNS